MNEQAVYQRPDSLTEKSTHYCPGCGHGIVHRLIAEIVDEMDLREKTVGVAPVGCSVVAYYYLKFDMSEAAHGRAPAVATGIKRAHPEFNVFAYQGDGDLASIGLAEVMHAANRGEGFTIIFINNTIYGMTGGQLAPTTLVGQKTTTSPGGRDAETMGHPMKMCEILNTLDNPYYIERTAIDTPVNIRKTRKALQKAFQYQAEGKGFTFVEILSHCPVHWKMDARKSMAHITDVVSKVFPVSVFRDKGDSK